MDADQLISARTYACASACGNAEVLVCLACDCGQRYCSKQCRQQARLASQRRASRKYQSSRVGSVNHARRQRRYRERKRQSEIVTHQRSQEACVGDLLQPRLKETQGAVRKPAVAWHCHWCGRPVARVARRDWLRHTAFEQVADELKGFPRGQSP